MSKFYNNTKRILLLAPIFFAAVTLAEAQHTMPSKPTLNL